MELQTGGFVGDIARSQAALGAFDKAAMASTGALGNWSGQANQAFNSIADGIAGLVKTTIALGVVGGLGIGKFVQTASELQTTSRQFEILIGNTEKANKVFGELYTFTLGKPIAFPDASKAAATLLGFGRSAEQVIPDMKTLSALSIVNGADLQALAVVFGQVTSRGALFGQDALQLISNRIPLTTILARHFGITMEEAAKKINGGTVSAEEFTKAMTAYAQSLDISKMSDTFKNRMISLQGSVRNFGLTILGLKIDPIRGLLVESGGLFDRISQGIADIGPKLKALGPTVAKAFGFLLDHSGTIAAGIAAIGAAFVTAKIGAAVTTLISLGGGFLTLIGVIGKATAVQWGFNAAMTANPVGAVVVGIVALVAALVFLQVKFGIFTKAFQAIKPAIDVVVNAFKNFYNTIKPILDAVIGFIKDQLVSSFKSIISIAKQFGEAMKPVVDAFKQILANKTVQTVLKAIGIALLLIVAAPVIAFFAGLMVVLKVVSTVLKFVADNFDTIKKVVLIVLAVAFAPLLLVIGAAILIFKALQIAIGFVVDVFNAVKNAVVAVGMFFQTVFTAIVAVVTTVFTTIMNLWTTYLKPVFDGIMFVLNAVFTIWTTIWTAILTIVFTVVSTIVQIIGVVLYGIVLFIYNQILTPIWNFFTTIWNAILAVVTTVVTAIWNVITTVFNTVWGFISGILNTIFGFISGIWNSIYGVISGVMSRVWGIISSIWNSIYSTVSGIVRSIANAVSSGFNSVVNAVSDGMSTAYNKVKEFVGKFLSAGKDVIDGLVRGISNGAGAVVNKVKEICSGALDAVKSFFGIKSPSKVMAKMGGFLSTGFAGGIENMGGAAVTAAANLAQSVLSEFNSMPMNALNTAGFGTIKPGNYNQTAAQMGISPSKIETNFYGPVDASNRGDEGRVMGTIARNEELAEKGIVSAAQGVSL